MIRLVILLGQRYHLVDQKCVVLSDVNYFHEGRQNAYLIVLYIFLSASLSSSI